MTRETTGALADAWDLASQLMDYASEKGFEPPQAFYISGGEIDVALPGGEKLYSDAGHLWCEDCADATLGKALPLMPESDRKSYSACPTDASGEDTCPHCSLCGTTLSGSISEEAVQDELYAYREDSLGLEEAIKPETAVTIAMLLQAAPGNAEAIAIGEAALAAIAHQAAQASPR